VETEKDLELSRPFYRTGLEYRLTQSLVARTGIQLAGDYVQHAFGVGIELAGVSADIAFMHQQVLGYTPFLSFIYRFK
jgi:outer membrane usher protein FimD/PapC